MSKVTSKLQLTVPKAIAVKYGIRAGDILDWEPAGDVIRVIPPSQGLRGDETRSAVERLRIFDQATKRQRARELAGAQRRKPALRRKERRDRGWTREELYTRGRAR